MSKYLLDVPDDEMADWRRQAAAADLSFAEWLRRAVRAGAGHTAGDSKIARAVAARTLPVKGTPYTPNDLAGPVTPDPRPTKKGRS